MDTSLYVYKNKSYRPCPTVSDKNSFFNSTFGVRIDESGAYFDKQAKFRRMRMAAFLTYFENEDMPSCLADILSKRFEKYSCSSSDDKKHLEEYIAKLIGGEEDITKDDIPILATLENARFVVLSNGEVTIIEPNPNIFGSYPKEIPKDKPREIVICLEENVFSRLEPIDEGCSSNKLRQKRIERKVASNKYRKGSSAGSKGVEYQVSLLAMVILNLTKSSLREWKLSTENEEAGKFDDIVLEWTGGAVLIQSKHKEDKRKRISLEELTSTNSKADDFSLPKYFLSYMEIKSWFDVENVMICTNAGIHEDALIFLNRKQANTDSLLYYEGVNCVYYTLKENIIPHLKEKSISYYWRNFKNKGIDDSVITDENLNDFLEHLQLYSNYPPLKNLEKIIEKSLSLMQHCNSSQGKITPLEMYSKVMAWFQNKNGVYFTELHVKALFAEICADKYCQRLEHYKISLQRNDLCFQGPKQVFQIVAKGRGLLETIKVYLTLIDQKANVLCLHHEDDFPAQKQVVEAFGLPKYVFLVILWPISTEGNTLHEICDELKSTLDRYKFKRVILITKDDALVGLEEIVYADASVTFEDLSSITQDGLIKENNILFQGKSISLGKLLTEKSTEAYGKAINSEILEKLVRKEEIIVGSSLSGLDQQTQRYYMKRTFSRKFAKTNEAVDTQVHQNQPTEGNVDEKIDEIMCDETFPEDDIFQLKEKLIVISDGAGMGKSTVLIKLASTIKQCQPDLWVVIITLNDYTRVLGDCLANGRDTLSVYELLGSRKKTKLTNHLEECIFSTHQKIVLMLDGMDEISPDYTEIVINIIKQCENESNFAKIVITTRPHVINNLEAELKVKPFILESFTEENQIDFLTNYWIYNLQVEGESGKEKCRRYARQLIRNISWTSLTNSADNNFVSIPLHVWMAAEVFQDDIWEDAEPDLKKKISVTELYELFFNKKWDIFYKKENPDRKTWTNQELANCFDQYRAYHRNLAVEVILGNDKSRCLSCYQPNDKCIETNLLKIGIVQKVNDTFSFIHRTLADYFLAEVLLTELQQNQSVEFQTFLIDTIFFEPQHSVTSIFLDSLLRKVVDTMPANIFETYRSSTNDNAKSYKLLHILAGEGSVAILQLIFKCIGVKICKSGIKVIRNFDTSSGGGKNTLSVIQDLIRKYGINIKNKTGQTPLHYAAAGGHTDVIEFLTAQETNDEAEDITTNPVRGLDVDNIVEVPTDVKMKDEHCSSILHLAATSGHLDTVKFLVKYGLDIHDVDDLNRTPLHIASAYGHLETVKYLLEAGTPRDVRNKSLNTPLHAAATFGHLEVVKFLIEVGSDLNGEGFRGRTSLHLASANGKLEIVKFLVEQGTDLRLRDNEGYTAIHVAAFSGRLEVVQFFVKYGLEFNVTNNNQQTSLHSAAANGSLPTVKYLLEIGMDREAKCNRLNTALHAGASCGHLSVVKLLVETGLDMDVPGFCGRTPLHIASLGGHLEMVKLLLQSGADFSVMDDKGDTALELATRSGHLDIVKLLN